MKSKIIQLLFAVRPSTNLASKGLLILRVITGMGILMHGMPKLMAPTSWMGDALPGILQLFAVTSEVLGGIFIIFGLFVPLSSLLMAFTMFVGIVLVHLGSADPLYRITVSNTSAGAGTNFFGLPLWFAKAGGHSEFGSGSGELAILYMIVGISLFTTGGGKYSLDQSIENRKG